MTGLTVLGSTGSVGVSTLDVVSRNPGRYRVVALTANSDYDALLAQCAEHRPLYAVLVDKDAARRLEAGIATAGLSTRVLAGSEGLTEVVRLPETDCVMAAIVGASGLLPVLAAAGAGKRLLLANKEALVVAGALLMDAAASNGSTLIPIDSEHNAIFQCLPVADNGQPMTADVRRILLTASGGPFLDRPLEELERVTPDDACAHPNWRMGRKISVDSATMMNKGLECIEACWLFRLEPKQVDIVVHPQSVVHSLVEYRDGSVLAQLGNPDMRTPIAHALAWPQRMESGVASLDLIKTARLDFRAPDMNRFPCLGLARAAAEAGNSAPATLNAANEVAVQAFLDGEIAFTEIAGVIEDVMAAHNVEAADSLPRLLEVDRVARLIARQALESRREVTAG